VATVEYDPNRTARIALLTYADGEKRYILHPVGLKVGDTIVAGDAVDILPGSYLVGGIACCVTARAQRLGDLAANTVVIRVPRLEQPDLTQLLAGRFNSLRAHPHLCARLRQQVSPAEAAAALQALVRRDALEPVARVQLFTELAARFRARVAFPPETVEGLADEQYVRDVVDVLYQTRRTLPEGNAPT